MPKVFKVLCAQRLINSTFGHHQFTEFTRIDLQRYNLS